MRIQSAEKIALDGVAVNDYIVATYFQLREEAMKIELNLDYFEEDGMIVALCPELQVSSFGDTVDDAEKSIKEALDLFFEDAKP